MTPVQKRLTALPAMLRVPGLEKRPRSMARFTSAVHRCGIGFTLALMALAPAASLAQPRRTTAVDTSTLGRLQLENGYPTAGRAHR